MINKIFASLTILLLLSQNIAVYADIDWSLNEPIKINNNELL